VYYGTETLHNTRCRRRRRGHAFSFHRHRSSHRQVSAWPDIR